jgi:hypothetical protein
MDTLTALVCVVAFALIYRVIIVALDRKGDLKAGARVGPGSFFVEVRGKKSSSRELPCK